MAAALFLLLALRVSWPPGYLTSVDLASFHFAGSAASSGVSPYDDELRADTARELGRHVYPFLSPPPAALLFVPLAWLGFESAAKAWLAADLVAALGILWFALQRSGLDAGAGFPRFAILLLWLGGSPLQSSLFHGQVNLAVLVLICAAWSCERAGTRPWLSGLCVGLAIVLKQSPVFLLPILVARRCWRTLAGATATIAALSIIAALLLPAETWTDWGRSTAPTLGYGQSPRELTHPASPYNQSLNGLLARLLLANPVVRPLADLPDLMKILAYALAGGAVVATAWVARHGTGWSIGRSREAQTDLCFAIALCTMFLLSPLSWEHHLVLVFPALVVGWRLARDGEGNRFCRLALIAATPLVTLHFPVDSMSLRSGWATVLISARFWGVLAIWFGLLWLARDRSRAGAASPVALAGAG